MAVNKKTSLQHRNIFYLSGRLGWNIDELREHVNDWTGSRISKLTFTQAVKVIRNLELSCGATGHKTGRPGKLSYQQRTKILKMQELLKWSDSQVNGMSRRVAKVDHWEWLNNSGASKLIESMKSIYKRTQEHGSSGNSKLHGPDEPVPASPTR